MIHYCVCHMYLTHLVLVFFIWHMLTLRFTVTIERNNTLEYDPRHLLEYSYLSLYN